MDLSSLDDAFFRRLHPALVALLGLAAGLLIPTVLFFAVRLVIGHWRLLLALLVGPYSAGSCPAAGVRGRQHVPGGDGDIAD